MRLSLHRRQALLERLPRLVLLLLIVQPLLDVLGYWQDQWGMANAVTLALRMLLLAGMVLLGWLLSERRWAYWLLALLLGLLTLGHVLANLPGGYRQPLPDLINLVRIYSLPVTTLCMMTFLGCSAEVFPAIRKGLFCNLILIALVQLLSTLTGTDPHTYHHEDIGVLGWFLWANSQSAILAILSPVCICYAWSRWPKRARFRSFGPLRATTTSWARWACCSSR